MAPISAIEVSNFIGEYKLAQSPPSATIYLLRISRSQNQTVVELDGSTVTNWSYKPYCLSWNVKENPHNAYLNLVDGFNGQVSFVEVKGKIWKEGNEPKENNVACKKETFSLQSWEGNYRTFVKDTGYSVGPELRLEKITGTDDIKMLFGDEPIQYKQLADRSVTWTQNDKNYTIQFYQDNQKQFKAFTGQVCNVQSEEPPIQNFFGKEDKQGNIPWYGCYETSIQGPEEKHYVAYQQFVFNSDSLTIGGHRIKGVEFKNPILTWTDSTNLVNGKVTFCRKDESSKNSFLGSIWPTNKLIKDGSKIYGIINSDSLQSWVGRYHTHMKDGTSFTKTGPNVNIVGSRLDEKPEVFLQDVRIEKWSFDMKVLTWNSQNGTSAAITFYLSEKGRCFAGQFWNDKDSKPVTCNWIGDQNSDVLSTIMGTVSQVVRLLSLAIKAYICYNILKAIFR